jgi:hypothetical protein
MLQCNEYPHLHMWICGNLLPRRLRMNLVCYFVHYLGYLKDLYDWSPPIFYGSAVLAVIIVAAFLEKVVRMFRGSLRIQPSLNPDSLKPDRHRQ